MSSAIDREQAGFTGSRDRDPEFSEPVVPHAVGCRCSFNPLEILVAEDHASRTVDALEDGSGPQRRRRRAGGRADVLDAALQAGMRMVPLQVGIPPPWNARHRVKLDQGAHQRLGIACERDGAEIAGGLVLLAVPDHDRHCDHDHHRPGRAGHPAG